MRITRKARTWLIVLSPNETKHWRDDATLDTTRVPYQTYVRTYARELLWGQASTTTTRIFQRDPLTLLEEVRR